MDRRTLTYLNGRFSDYYRRNAPILPPDADAREWGYIPWSTSGTTMIRHQSLLDMGDISAFLERESPQHVYFSAGKYRHPGAGSMPAKHWEGSDLIFDLDADHLPAVTPSEDSYASMLSACKEALWRLLEFLVDDFAFTDISIVFSGSRGYHVHVRDAGVQELDREARREIVDYVRGNGVTVETLIRTETVAGGFGRSTPAQKRELPVDGGWGARVGQQLRDLIDEVRSLPEDDALEQLRAYEGIGADRANKILVAANTNADRIASGAIDVNDGVYQLTKRLVDDTIASESAAIDEPVTTDIRRLIRLPGSLHGGTGLVVTPIEYEALDEFDPLVDAVSDVFTGHSVRVRATGGPPVELGGETFTVPDGVTSLPEYVAMFLMAGGRAEKEQEQ